MTATDIKKSTSNAINLFDKEVLNAFSRANEGMQKVFKRRAREFILYSRRREKMKTDIRERKLRRK